MAARERLMSMAEQELGAFIGAVTELYGSGEARTSTEDWLNEMKSMQDLSGFTPCEWRRITIAAAARLANRLVESRTSAAGLTTNASLGN